MPYNVNCKIDRTKHAKLFRFIDDWAKSEKTREYFRDGYDAAFKLLDTVFLVDPETLTQVPITEGKIQVYKDRLNDLVKRAEKGTLANSFSTSLWQTSKFAKKDPVIANLLGNMQRTQRAYSEYSSETGVSIKLILDDITEAAINKGMDEQQIKNKQKELSELNELYAKAKVAQVNNDADWKNLHREYIAKENELMNGAYGSLVKKFVNIVEKDIPEITRTMEKKKDADVPKSELLLELKKRYPEENALLSAVSRYVDASDNLYTILENGAKKHIDSMVRRLEETGRVQSSRQLKAIQKKLNETILPNRESGFYPHYTRDFNITFMEGYMAKIDKLQDAMNPYNLTTKTKSVREAINDIDLYISNHNKNRAKDKDGNFIFEYNKNPFEVLSAYANDVTRFNLNSFMSSHYLDALSSIEKIYKTNGNAQEYALNISKYIQDMHVAYNGNSQNSVSTSNVTRTLLSFEFISKLGFNLRGAARNYTQRLLDFVVFGSPFWGGQQKRINDYLKKQGIEDSELTGILEKKGILFEEASPELIGTVVKQPVNELNMVEYDEATNKFKYVKKSKMESFANVASKIASVTSVFHRAAENMNRKKTFRVAFGQMHKFLNTVDFKSKLAAEGKTDKQIQQKIQRLAENYAINMTVLNHFDYSQYAKSPFMRTKLGALVGQFQHYSFEFFEKNIGILKEAKADVKNGNVLKSVLKQNGGMQGVSQAYRMSLAYFIAPTIAAAITGINFSNLIQHDTAERVKRLATMLTGDEEEKLAATYGKPFAASVLGPFMDTVIDVGMMLEFNDMAPDSIKNYFAGYEKYDPQYELPNTVKFLSVVNVASARAYQRHLPQLREGRIGWALQSELGGYPTKESKDLQKKAGFAPIKKSKKQQNILASLDYLVT